MKAWLTINSYLKPQLLKNDLVSTLGLNKEQAKMLGSRLKETPLMVGSAFPTERAFGLLP